MKNMNRNVVNYRKTSVACISNILLTCILGLSVFAFTGCNDLNENKEPEVTQSTATEVTTEATTEATSETTETTYEEPTPTTEFHKKEIVIDYYKIPEVYSLLLTESEIQLYNDIVTAWLNYEPKVECKSADDFYHVWGVIQGNFFLAFGDFNEDLGFDSDDNYLYFNYSTTSKEEHDEVIRAFEARVQSFFDDIDESEQGYELARHIYKNFNKTISYSWDIPESGNYTLGNSSGYAALMYGKGVCMSFEKGYNYLALQAGIEAFGVTGGDHAWGVIKMDDKYYFTDPTWDYVDDPENYSYFCFGLDRRERDGYQEEDMHLCYNFDYVMSDYITVEREYYRFEQ